MRRFRLLPNCPQGYRGPRGGLTLVEVLVVTAIFAVVASLIAGTAFTARSSAVRAQCASNLRQIGVAVQLYIADHQALPLMYYTHPVGSPRLPWEPQRFLPSPPYGYTYWDSLGSYLRDKRVIVCPARARLADWRPDGTGCYTYNNGAVGLAATDVHLSPDRALLMWDALLYPGPHLWKFNSLFLDGHVKAYEQGYTYPLWTPDDIAHWPAR